MRILSAHILDIAVESSCSFSTIYYIPYIVYYIILYTIYHTHYICTCTYIHMYIYIYTRKGSLCLILLGEPCILTRTKAQFSKLAQEEVGAIPRPLLAVFWLAVLFQHFLGFHCPHNMKAASLTCWVCMVFMIGRLKGKLFERVQKPATLARMRLMAGILLRTIQAL